MLIRHAEIDCYLPSGARCVDIRIEAGHIVALAPQLTPEPHEPVLEAHGHTLLPGLHDHHLHLTALAVALDSLSCGPPEVMTAEALADTLQTHARGTNETAEKNEDGTWIRGIGYHESVAGNIDRAWLDRIVPQRPVRIQHRSGRLWICNSLALERLGIVDVADGRLLDADLRLREHTERSLRHFPSLLHASRLLAQHGVTGVTDTTPHNDLSQFQHFAKACASGDLWQDVLLMGDASLDAAQDRPELGLWRGATKFHLHEYALPDFDTLVAMMQRSHLADRPVAIHCVTVAELVFALGALEMAGAHPGDRIEHAALVPPDILPLLAARGVTVVTQPNFIFERGDVYRQEVDAIDQPWLYRLRGLQEAGIALAGSTDAPFGQANPWLAMQAAVERCSRNGIVLGAGEALSPEAALRLFLSPLSAPGASARRLKEGMRADLCLLDRNWQQARTALGRVRIEACFKQGKIMAISNKK